MLDRSDPQQWTGYTYADNNPVTLSDPSGLWPDWGKVWKSTTTWVGKHQSQIAGAVAGVVVTSVCLGASWGLGSVGCMAAGGAAAGAVTNLWASKVAHTQTFSWKSLAVDTVVGGVVGAATGALGKVAAPLLSKAGSAIAGAARAALSRAAPAVRQAATAVTRAASNTARAALRSETSGGATQGSALAQVTRNKAIGDAASDAIASRYPNAMREVTKQAASGVRRIDVLTDDGMAIESKVGRTGLTARVRQELARDAELLADDNGGVDSVFWEFSRSPTTGRVGPTPRLQDALDAAKIPWGIS